MLSSRAIAAQILVSVLKDHKSLSQALLQIPPNHPDASFIQELCYGVLRWYWQLEKIIKLQLSKPLKTQDIDIQALMLLGLYQLIHLNTPAHAALNETVQAARQLKKTWAVKLINGVLRNFLRQQPDILAKINQDIVAQYTHPSWLIKLIQQAWPTQWQKILAANNQRPPMILRVNRLENSRDEYLHLLNQENIEAEPLAHTSHGIILKTACAVNKLPGFFAGKVSVQDGAAQFAADLLDLKPGQRVLDACAAPGGKTAHILETQPDLAALISLDVDQQRCQKIQENLQRLKLTNRATILTADVLQPKTWWDGELFDRILLDAPCSATGVIRRHPDIKYLRRSTDIPALAKAQLEMLNTLWPLLKPDGLLVYATCSILSQENSEVLQKFIATHTDAKETIIHADWGHSQSMGRQILSGENNMDGFYYAALFRLR